MNVIELLIAAMSAAIVVAYVCRLDWLQFRKHKLKVILFHVALMSCAGACGASAISGALSLQDIAGLAASAFWLWVSIPSWRHGPPSHVTKPEPLSPLLWPEVKGGGE